MVIINGGEDKWTKNHNIQKVLFVHVGKTSNRLGERKDILKKVILKFEMGQAKKMAQKGIQYIEVSLWPLP